MLRNVLQESCFVYKTFVTRVTFVWFISLVASGVGLEVTELTEGFGAPWMSAFVRLIPGVCPNMLLQMRQLRELALTNFTPRRRRKKGYINGGLAGYNAVRDFGRTTYVRTKYLTACRKSYSRKDLSLGLI